MPTRHRFLAALLLLTIAMPAAAAEAVFQYTISIPMPPDDKGKARPDSAAFLWIPPSAKQVRGVLMGGMTLAERQLVQDPAIRKACAEAGVAIVFLKCGLGATDLQKVLDELAKVSGYQELAVAPLFFVGHSAGGPQAKDAAIKFAARCFGLMQYRGGTPSGGENEKGDKWPGVPAGVPTLTMVGQFDEFGGLMRDEKGYEGAWERARADVIKHRTADQGHLSSLVVEPGAGHFAWSERNGEYLALFLKKAAQARIPDFPADASAPVTCKAVDPKSGWLTNLTIRSKGEFPPAAYEEYKGDKGQAAWHFDREMADATVAYHNPKVGGFDKKDQFIKWNDPFWVDAGTRYFFQNLTWVDDGQVLEVHPVYADKYPATQPSGGPRWLQAGEPVGHSSAPIQVRGVSGALVPVGPTKLRIRHDALSPATEGGRMTFMAYSVGDGQFRHTELVGMTPRGFSGLTAGRDQTITFPAMDPPAVGGPPVALKATTDAGLPVEYYVAYGPAVVEDGKLKLVDVPARVRYPIEIKVVAYQFGSGLKDKAVKTAKPVEQVIKIDKPAR